MGWMPEVERETAASAVEPGRRRPPSPARSLRVYGKKRGDRRIGFGPLGSAGLTAFFAFFFLAGCFALLLILKLLVIPEWRVNHRFVAGQCTVLGKRIGESHGESGVSYRPEVLVRYQVRGRQYENWTYDITGAYSTGKLDKEGVLQRFIVGRQYSCWYDPDEPERVVLVRGYTEFAWLMLLLPVTFLAVGGGGLAYRCFSGTTSAERRAALAQRIAQLDWVEQVGGPRRELACVPAAADLTNSPGTKLTYRLPIAVSPGWALVPLGASCLLWNAMVALFATIALKNHLGGKPEWFLTLLLVPFALVGLWLIAYTIRQLLVATGVGPTLVEISDHPLYPGGRYQVFLSQGGRLSVNSLKLLLVCEEQATYQQGTNTRTENRRVYQAEVFARERFEIRHDFPFETSADLDVPAGAMHSFKAGHNEIKWKLVVQGDVAGWPDFEREFPLLVHPAENRRATA